MGHQSIKKGEQDGDLKIEVSVKRTDFCMRSGLTRENNFNIISNAFLTLSEKTVTGKDV